jgi:hypothetical protein
MGDVSMNIWWARFLLLLPYIGLLYVPIYASRYPVLFGFPFFYWYQLAWVPLTSLLLWIVYRRLPDED